MTYPLDAKTSIECRKGLQSVKKDWGSISFYHIGAKNPDLARVHSELEQTGVAEWEGFTLIHSEYGR